MTTLSDVLNTAAKDKKWNLLRAVQDMFGDPAMRAAADFFIRAGLPVPSRDEYMTSTEGALVFLDDYGLLIRIEIADPHDGSLKADRIDDPWIIQPIATLRAGNALIEICPGGAYESKEENNRLLGKRLRKRGIDFFDGGVRNVARLPITLPEFPDGVPVICDRLAVRRLAFGVSLIRNALKKLGVLKESVLDEQLMREERALYGPLHESFAAAWADPEKMKSFWDLCRQYKAKGKLIAGWMDGVPLSDKGACAAEVGAAYARSIASDRVKKPSPTPFSSGSPAAR